MDTGLAAKIKCDLPKRISVSSKRQITIPLQFFEKLRIGSAVECELRDGGIFIRPIDPEPSGEFDEFILADLIKEGYQGEELLEKFKEMRRQIRPAFLRMLEESAKEARAIPLEELFGSGDEDCEDTLLNSPLPTSETAEFSAGRKKF